jgi:hypothetical protein
MYRLRWGPAVFAVVPVLIEIVLKLNDRCHRLDAGVAHDDVGGLGMDRGKRTLGGT